MTLAQTRLRSSTQLNRPIFVWQQLSLTKHLSNKLNVQSRPMKNLKTLRLTLVTAVLLLGVQHTALAQDHAAKIQEVLALAHKYRQFNGSALVAENGKVIYKGGFGLANMEWNI